MQAAAGKTHKVVWATKQEVGLHPDNTPFTSSILTKYFLHVQQEERRKLHSSSHNYLLLCTSMCGTSYCLDGRPTVASSDWRRNTRTSLEKVHVPRTATNTGRNGNYDSHRSDWRRNPASLLGRVQVIQWRRNLNTAAWESSSYAYNDKPDISGNESDSWA